MKAFLQKLKQKVPVALVGGSDLVKIAEQMGDSEESHGRYCETCLNPALNNLKNCLNLTLLKVPLYNFKCMLTLSKPNTFLN